MKDPRRLEATQRWRAVAAGEPDADTLAWLVGVARKVLKANDLPAPVRRDAMVQAVGLHGTDYYEPSAVRSMIDHVDALPDSQFGVGRSAKTARVAFLRMLVRTALHSVENGPCTANDDAIDARIRRARKLKSSRQTTC